MAAPAAALSSTCRLRVPRSRPTCSRGSECRSPSEPASAASSDFYPTALRSSSSNSRTATILTGASSDPHRLPPSPAIDIFPGGSARLRSGLGFLPTALERPPALVWRLVDLRVRVQPRQGIVTDRAQRDDLLPRLKAQGIFHLNSRHFRVA